MGAIAQSIYHMFDIRYLKISGYHSPGVRENIWIMDSHITSRQIQFKAGRKLPDHLHSAFHDLNKRDSRARSGVIVDSQQLITMLLMPDDKGRAVIRAKNS